MSRFAALRGAFLPSWPRFVLGVFLGALPTAGYITILYEQVAADLKLSTPFPVPFVQVWVFSMLLLIFEFKVWPAVFGHARPRPPLMPNAGALAAAPISAPTSERESDTARRYPPLLNRLPPEHATAEIVSISMHDHYAEITTTAGKALILMRLRDAIELLENHPGARIHRSHWVARAHVDQVMCGGDGAGRSTARSTGPGRTTRRQRNW